MTAFPEWMGPNIEARHVEMMRWSVEPVPPLRDLVGCQRCGQMVPATHTREDCERSRRVSEENRYAASERFVALLTSGRQLAIYAPDRASALIAVASAFLAGERLDKLHSIRADVAELWIGEGDAAHCRVLVDGRKAPG